MEKLIRTGLSIFKEPGGALVADYSKGGWYRPSYDCNGKIYEMEYIEDPATQKLYDEMEDSNG